MLKIDDARWRSSNVIGAIIIFGVTSTISFFLLRDVLPSVLQDEYEYLSNSRLGMSSTSLPNYLFFALYSLNEFFGDSFYVFAKVLNQVFFFLTTLALYLWMLGKVRPFPALTSALTFQVSAFAVFGSFFMPEAMYSFTVILSLLLFFEAVIVGSRAKTLLIGLAGGSLGAAMLIKPHALIILIALASYLVFMIRALSTRERAKSLAVLLLSFMATRVLFGFSLQGVQSLDFFRGYFSGSEFSSTLASQFEEVVPKVSEVILALLANSLQHFALIVFLSFCALGVLFSHRRGSFKFTFFILFVMFVTSLFIAAFEVYVTVFLADDHLARVLLRHYEFLFPLLWAGLVIGFSKNDGEARDASFASTLRVFILCTVFLGIALAGDSLWGASRYSDSGFTTFLRNPALMWTYVLGNFGALYLLLRRTKPSPAIAASIALTISVVGGAASVGTVRIENLEPYPSDVAAQQIREDYPDLRGTEILLIAPNITLAQAGAFLINKAGIEILEVGVGSSILEKDMPKGYSLWVQFPGVTIVTDEVSIFKLDGAAIYDLSKPSN